jgi:hypothetical protein
MPDEMQAFEETERLLVEGLESGTARQLDMAELKKRAQALLKQEKLLSLSFLTL